MRQVWLGVAIAAALYGQEVTPAGVLRGTVVERDEASSGEIAIRAPDNHVFRFRYDGKTWAERNGRRISISDMRTGEDVEIISDLAANKPAYVRSIRVVSTVPRALPRYTRLPRIRSTYRSPYDNIFPRGDMTFAGSVAEINADSLLLRAHGKGPTRILLRDDTRFLANGGEVTAGDLPVNARVFVRAGRNLDGEIEAYQVVWGKIFSPRD